MSGETGETGRTGRTGTSSSAYYASLGPNGHLTYMMSTPPPSPPSSSSSSDSDSEPASDSYEEENDPAKCTDMRPILFQAAIDRFPFLESSSLADITESNIWNIEIRLKAKQSLVRKPSGGYGITPVIRISFGMIPFSSGPYEIMRFTRDGCYGDKQEFETIRDLLDALERYLRHLEPA